MPQMMPLNWLSLMFFFLLIFFIFNNMNYYNSIMQVKFNNFTKNKFLHNWKW
uniref:ATP synthase complex subunit 8 n=1 Tax=Phyllobrotica quadrimaculata TaxID=428708 RepID=A0A343C1U7_9CUCU|nr:ATP synthase F0 subunit 8 [Phyllobrotica quadrimaculata]